MRGFFSIIPSLHLPDVYFLPFYGLYGLPIQEKESVSSFVCPALYLFPTVGQYCATIIVCSTIKLLLFPNGLAASDFASVPFCTFFCISIDTPTTLSPES